MPETKESKMDERRDIRKETKNGITGNKMKKGRLQAVPVAVHHRHQLLLVQNQIGHQTMRKQWYPELGKVRKRKEK